MMQITAAVLLVALSAAAEEPKDGKDQPPKKDPQAGYEPRSKPGEGQKFLEKFVGEWDVEKSFYPRSGETPIRQKGECRQTMIHGGRFLQSDFTFRRGEAVTTGKGLIGFEVATGLFTSVWTDSRATRMSFRQGKEKFDGEQIVLYSTALESGAAREARRSRTVTRLEDDGRKIVHRQYAVADGGKERLIMDLVLIRKAKTPASGR